MKTLFISLLTFSSLTSHAACPDLSGVYKKCTNTGMAMTIMNQLHVSTNTDSNGTPYYLFSFNDQNGKPDYETYIPDGKTRGGKVAPYGVKAIEEHTTRCIDDQLVSRVDIKATDGSLAMSTLITITTNGKKMVMNSTMDGEQLEKVVCVK